MSFEESLLVNFLGSCVSWCKCDGIHFCICNKLMYNFIEHDDSDEAYRVLHIWTISILDI